MKNVRRKLVKRTRAQNFDELEKAFFELVQKHNTLSTSHRQLKFKTKRLKSKINELERDNTGYGLTNEYY